MPMQAQDGSGSAAMDGDLAFGVPVLADAPMQDRSADTSQGARVPSSTEVGCLCRFLSVVRQFWQAVSAEGEGCRLVRKY